VDNTFGTPYLVRPIAWGADIVIHSATKFLGGHGTTMGGVIVESGTLPHGLTRLCGGSFTGHVRKTLLHDTGATMAPFNAFLLLQGIETLSLRVERHTSNALEVVKVLSEHPMIERVSHPSLESSPYHALYKKYFPNGGISVFTADIRGGKNEAWAFINHLKLFSLLANVADVKSLVIHPATTTHADLSLSELAEQDIRPNTIRLSIGTEHINDIIADLRQAFDAVG
jgi:O-acetylhomoserine (thiol)-lyase